MEAGQVLLLQALTKHEGMMMFCAITCDSLLRSHCIFDPENCHPGVILVDEVADGEPGTCNVVVPKQWKSRSCRSGRQQLAGVYSMAAERHDDD